MTFSNIWNYGIDTAINKQNIPLSVHMCMFLPALVGQGTQEQQNEWIPRTIMNIIFGTYAQVRRFNNIVYHCTYTSYTNQVNI